MFRGMTINCSRLAGLILLATAALVILFAVAFAKFGWFVLLVPLAVALYAWYRGKRALTGLLRRPFELKGRVLDGAEVQVFSSEFVETMLPDPSENEQEPEPRLCYRVELEITPQATEDGAFALWDPTEILVVAADSKASPTSDPTDDEVGQLESVRVWDGTGWQEDTEGKHAGALRLQLVISLERNVEHFALQYYFQRLCEIRLPPVIDV